MKKVFASVLVGLALGAVSAVSAIDMSVGAGGVFASDFGGQGRVEKGKEENVSYEERSTLPWIGGGVGAFLDVNYAEIGLGLTFTDGSPHIYAKEGSRDTSFTYKNVKMSATLLNISVLGKYPVSLGTGITVYPAAGIDYALCISGVTKAKDERGKWNEEKWDGKKEIIDYGEGYTYEIEHMKAGDFSHLWIKFGAGCEYGLTDALFLRAQALYGIGFACKMINDEIDETKKRYKEWGEPAPDIKAALSHGLTVKVGVGFRL